MTTTGRYALTPEEREFLRRGVLACVRSAYEGYRAGHGSEPRISVGYLYDWFASNYGWGPLLSPRECEEPSLKRFVTATLRRNVFATAEALRREGKLASSIGESESGREARLYEPGREP